MKIVIVEDFLMVRDIVRAACSREPDLEVVAEAASGSEAVAVIIQTRPDVVLLDLGLPDFDGFEVLNRIRDRGDESRILVLSGHGSPYLTYRVERAGIHGFVDKRVETVDRLRDAFAAFRANRTFFAGTFLEIQARRRGDPFSFDKVLTDQEILVLSLVAHCFDDARIAEYLKISRRTVESHRTSIMRKLDLHSRTAIMHFAHAQGFASGSVPPRHRNDAETLPLITLEQRTLWTLS